MEFVGIARKEVIDAIHKLNSRPRKCLDYATFVVKGIRL
jgi:IS30 family transposase